MYVSTFYSFKGGVGRSMALANVAAHFAQQGKKVLVVDFDLEAPSLDTFPLFKTKKNTLGVTDFVSKYIREDRAPAVEDYIQPSSLLDNLHIMPSGTWKGYYAQQYRSIDWQRLYEEQDGYLLMEDMKAQWREFIEPDYVLIDSRNGNTDIGSICTRQLPNSVVILFFPNYQNLRGLEKIVKDIRSEALSLREFKIDLHFVMANVPDLDDKDGILTSIRSEFTKNLKMTDDPLVIHRYESLSVLNPSIFTIEHPKSRLAQEYRDLSECIAEGNLAD